MRVILVILFLFSIHFGIKAQDTSHVVLPNVFTPDDDGVNDIYTIDCDDEVVFIYSSLHN